MIHRSIAAKLLLSLVLFLAAPVAVYQQFSAADAERNALLLASIRGQGETIARALSGPLGSAGPADMPTMQTELARYVNEQIDLKLLFQPAGSDPGTFYFVAAVPPETPEVLEQSREAIERSGLLATVWDSCTGERSITQRSLNPRGREELTVSVVPVKTARGCWALITATSSGDILATSIGRPYWQRPEVLVAAAIYIAMAGVIMLLLADLGLNLRRFVRLARVIAGGRGDGRSFRELNRVPELTGVAGRFDAMVQRLRDTAAEIRNAAEESAHALKTPIGTITQSLEPLKRVVPAEDRRGRRAIEIIEQSCRRLSELVATARRSTEAMAWAADPPSARIDLSELAEGLCASFAGPCEARGVHLAATVDPGLIVLGGEDMLETVLENMVENAVSFSAAGQAVEVSVTASGRNVAIRVRDHGIGVEPERLGRIFEKGYSHRAASGSDAAAPAHFGLGLWLVKRNVEALGGTVAAANAAPRGLEMTVTLPRAD